MTPDIFKCDVCSEPITTQDVTTHLKIHQNQVSNLLNRLPHTTNDEFIDNPTSPCHISTPSTRRTRRRKPKPSECPRCSQCFSRPDHLARHYATHYFRRIDCPQCDLPYSQGSLFNSHPCSKDPSPEFLKVYDTLREEIEIELGLKYKFRRPRINRHFAKDSATRPDVSHSTPEPPTTEAYIDRSATCQASSSRQEPAVEASEHAGLDGSSTKTELQMGNTYSNNVAINVPLELHYQQNCMSIGWPHGTFADQNAYAPSSNTWFLPERQAAALETNYRQDW